MVIEKEILPLGSWLLQNGPLWLAIIAALAVAGLLLTVLVQSVRFGPRVAVRSVREVVGNLWSDVFGIRPHRVSALAWLALQESIRRKVVYVFVVFALMVAFAGWFLDPASDNPAGLYLSFVLNTTGFLSLVLAVVLSAPSLPNDLKNRTIQTIVTKPVRASEVVLGRILGFSLTGSLLLLGMACVSYVFVHRTLSHTHVIDAARLQDVRGSEGAQHGRTSRVNGHVHEFNVDAKGQGRTVVEQGHWHEVTSTTSEGTTQYVVGPPRDLFTAKVPIYGSLGFISRDGTPAEKGINVGNEWTYLSYIDGASRAAAQWTFEGVTPERFPNGLPIEMNLKVFRTFKGDIEKTILGSIRVRKPLEPMPLTDTITKRQAELVSRQQRRLRQPASEPKNFSSQEYKTAEMHFPRKLLDADGKEIDLFADLAPDGRLEVEVQCLQAGQYFGMAQPDVYLRAAYAPFWINFMKCYLGTWLQMVLVICFGVMFSTFLSGPVAMLATLSALIGGYFTEKMLTFGLGQNLGGGVMESMVRLAKQSNLTTALEPGWGTTFVKIFDSLTMPALVLVSGMLPNFSLFNQIAYVSSGYDIPPDLMLTRVIAAAAYFVPLVLVGYLFFRNREVAI